MNIEEIKKLRNDMINFCKKEGKTEPTVESMYDKKMLLVWMKECINVPVVMNRTGIYILQKI